MMLRPRAFQPLTSIERGTAYMPSMHAYDAHYSLALRVPESAGDHLPATPASSNMEHVCTGMNTADGSKLPLPAARIARGSTTKKANCQAAVVARRVGERQKFAQRKEGHQAKSSIVTRLPQAQHPGTRSP